jgi:putative glutamine amidotransferase
MLAAALGADELDVNSYHHQGVAPSGLASDLRASALADSPIGPLVEGIEHSTRRFVVAVQTHPERTESTPNAFGNLFAAFADACRQRSRPTTRRPG